MSHCPFHPGRTCPGCGLPIRGVLGRFTHREQPDGSYRMFLEIGSTTALLHRVAPCVTEQPPANDDRYAGRPIA